MAAAAADKSKRLPKELQDYKREMKKQPFKDRVKAYFDCAPYIRDLDSKKREVIISTFTKDERREFYGHYEPIHSAIERYGDRIRAINGNRFIYANYIETALRQRNAYRYTADFLNLLLPKVEGALRGTEEAIARDNLKEIVDILHSYRSVSLNLKGSPDIKFNEKKNRYETPIDGEEFLLGAINTLRGILSLLKSYLEALKEFMEWVGAPELLPKEFKDMEADLLLRFHDFKPKEPRAKNPDADKFPLFFAESKVAEEYISIDYKALPLTIDISGNNNPFANAYRRFFNY